MVGYFLKTKAFWLCALVGLLAVVAAGCGSGGDSSSAAAKPPIAVETGPLSKAQFVKRADAICARSAKQLKAAYVSFTTQHEKQFWVHRSAAISDLARTVFVPNYEKRIEEIAAIGAPSSDKGDIENFIRSFEDALSAMSKQPVKASESLNTVFAKPFQAEQRYGLQGCIGSAF